ncbi:hypothetical protein [Xanthomonas euroxanthea]|uniref:hypothetical protein n=1 Tax=Xanthomonas euroxanthea TaxID=2259622 RepID=UPI0016184BD8|nr:hypothetical protein [Xanthomonas euroxanthea]MBB5766503.1 hypothetical protein [Xanthomonas euroxanthea]
MQVRFTGDSNSETRTDRVLDILVSGRSFFNAKDYGAGLEKIVFVLMCRSPELGFTRRVRFSKKDLSFYSDIMLDYALMRGSTMEGRMMHVVDQVYTQLSGDFSKRKISSFDVDSFLADLKGWLTKISIEYEGHAGNGWEY